MPYDKNIHHRRSIRLRGYDYSQPGLYFITICCQHRASLFGMVVHGEMILNNAGKIANSCWLEIPAHFRNVVLHQHVIMPNHVHGIIELKQQYIDGKAKPIVRSKVTPFRSPSQTIGSVVRGFKTGVTQWMRANTAIKTVWQANYFENIVRNQRAYRAISRYIANNPSNWRIDRFHVRDSP